MKIIPCDCGPLRPRVSPQSSNSSWLMRIPYLARQEHWITLPSHLIPSRPRDAEN